MRKKEKIIARLKEIHEGMESVGFLSEDNADDMFDLLMEEEERLLEKLKKLRGKEGGLDDK